jgi:hypothetical protein
MELIWLTVTILTAIMAIHSSITKGLKESIGLILLILLPLSFYMVRRKSRKK